MICRLSKFLLISLLASLAAIPVQAQNAITLAQLKISFWPEYDRPAVLVIYRGTLAAGTPLPAALEFSLPAQYGPPIAVAYADENGNLFDLEHTVATSGDSMTVSFEAPTSIFQFEYYDTSLDLSSGARRYTFNALAPYEIGSLVLEAQQPIGALNFAATPQLDNETVGQLGLTHFDTSFSNLGAGDPITLELSYTKGDNTLSAGPASPVVTPDLPVSEASARLGDWGAVVLIAFSIAIVALGVGAVVWYLRTQGSNLQRAGREPHHRHKQRGHPPRPKEVTLAPPARAGDPPSPPAETTAPNAQAAAFCHECGQKTLPDDRFCRNCGTELRR